MMSLGTIQNNMAFVTNFRPYSKHFHLTFVYFSAPKKFLNYASESQYFKIWIESFIWQGFMVIKLMEADFAGMAHIFHLKFFHLDFWTCQHNDERPSLWSSRPKLSKWNLNLHFTPFRRAKFLRVDSFKPLEFWSNFNPKKNRNWIEIGQK